MLEGEESELEKALKAQLEDARTKADKRDKLLRQAQADLAKQREDFSGLLEVLGIELPEDADERKAKLEALKAEREKQRSGKMHSKEEVDRLLSDREKKHKGDLDKASGLAERRLKRLREVLIDNEATRAAAELGATEGGLEAIRMKIAAEADIVEEDDELRAVIKGKDGARLNPKSEPMSIRERVEEIANDEKYASWFRAQGKAGAGTGSNQAGSGKGGLLRVTTAQLADAEFYKQHRDAILSGKVQIVE